MNGTRPLLLLLLLRALPHPCRGAGVQPQAQARSTRLRSAPVSPRIVISSPCLPSYMMSRVPITIPYLELAVTLKASSTRSLLAERTVSTTNLGTTTTGTIFHLVPLQPQYPTLGVSRERAGCRAFGKRPPWLSKSPAKWAHRDHRAIWGVEKGSSS